MMHVLLILAAWCVASFGVGCLLGRAIHLANMETTR